MANQQLVDYITQQTRAGVTKEVVKNTLTATGWSERDVQEAVDAAMGTSPAVPSPAASGPVAVAGTGIKPVVMPAAKPIAASPAAASSSASVNIFDAKTEPVFEPKSKNIQSGTPSAISSGSVLAIAAQRSGNHFMSVILPLFLGVIAVGAGVLAYMMWSQKSGLDGQVAALTAQSAAFQAQIQGLEKEKNDAVARAAAVADSTKDLEGELSLFVVPMGSSPSSPVTVKGTINGLDKVSYTVTTAKGIMLIIKNSKDPAVSSLLPSFVGKTTEITGTHVPGARDITITALNGKPIVTPTAP